MIEYAPIVNEQELELLQLALADYQLKLEDGAALVPSSIKEEYRKKAIECENLFSKILNLPPINAGVMK